MPIPLFSKSELERFTHASVRAAGQELFRQSSALKKLQIVGTDIIATFRGMPESTVVISRKPLSPFQSACTCGFGYGGACEHVIAAMLAANSRQAIQVGMDFGSPGGDENAITQPAEQVHDQEGNVDKQDDSTSAPIETVEDKPTPRLYIKEWNEVLLVELRFAYLGGIVEYASGDRSREKLVTEPLGRIVKLQRAIVREMDIASGLADAGLVPFRQGTFTPSGDPSAWVRTELQKLSARGFDVYGRESLVNFKTVDAKPSMKLSVTSVSSGLVSCTVDISYEGALAPLSAVFDAVIAGKKYVKLSNGSLGVIPEAWIEKLAVLFAFCEEKPEAGTIRLHETRIAAVSALESVADSIAWEGTKNSVRERLKDFSCAKSKPVPPAFKGALRSYQQAGYEWFYSLSALGLGGCLADDMGLGKTVQALVLLLSEKSANAQPKTSLLVVPTSLLFNWQREARTFAPTLLVMNYHGRDRERFRASDMALADVVLTTYGTVQREIELFKTLSLNYILLDEAQAIKNLLSETAQTIHKISSRNKLALSGTPIENNLSELWSLFSFLNPGMLGSYRRFADGFVRPIEKERNKERAEFLRTLVSPCILRRTKSQVAKELPPKTEILLNVPMTAHQRMLYTMTRDACRADIMRTIDNAGIDRARMHILQALTRLRQICCHPKLVDPAYKGDSGKFEALSDLLDNVVAEKHKSLIFSQFVSVLDLIADKLDERKIRHEYLTGHTANRRRPVDNFQEDPNIPVMLISLKAGGVGLNLTAADYVILFDPWWNPAVENQAADRAYRIGQTKPVFVYKRIAEDSVEQRVIELQKAKRELFDAIITAEQSVFKNIKKEEIERLFE